jgi:hypothetical protein
MYKLQAPLRGALQGYRLRWGDACNVSWRFDNGIELDLHSEGVQEG